MSIFFGLLGGLGLFLFGMQKMAEGLQKAAGDKLRNILELFTSKPIVAVLTGAIVTVLVQSSSTTTVMIVGFVNAGLMNLTQAIGTIMGANIGTTITAQVVSFNIYEVALPAIGIGFLVYYLGKNRLQKYLGQGVLGFGMLLFGMLIMSDSLRPLRTYEPFLELLVTLGQYPYLGVLAGAAFTVLVQSSSATTGLVIAFGLQDLITLPSGLALVLGANLGTCVTAQLASLGANLTARRAAMAHVLFNAFGVLFFLLLLGPFTRLVQITGDTVTRQIANAHTIFNLTNSLLLFPFIPLLVKTVRRLIPGEEEILERKPKYLDPRIVHTPAAVPSANKEVLRMAEISLEMVKQAMTAFMHCDPKLIPIVEQKEEVVNDLERAITTYLTEAGQDPLTAKQSHRIIALMHIINDIERIGDHAINITELAQERMDHKLVFSEQAQEELAYIYGEVFRILKLAILYLEQDRPEDAKRLTKEDDIVDDLEQQYRTSHIERLNKGLCNPEAGVVFLDVISNLERIADHANNLAQAVAASKPPVLAK